MSDICFASKHADGESHGWVFDGDDPYVVCGWCKERRDAVSGRKIEPHVPSVADIPDDELLRRAVRSAKLKGRRGYKYQRWTAVSEQFQLGATYSRQLCIRFNLDPDEMVKI